jgi:hypothetical protein
LTLHLSELRCPETIRQPNFFSRPFSFRTLVAKGLRLNNYLLALIHRSSAVTLLNHPVAAGHLRALYVRSFAPAGFFKKSGKNGTFSA